MQKKNFRFILTAVFLGSLTGASMVHAEFYGVVDRAQAEIHLETGALVKSIDLAQYRSFDLRQKTATLYSKLGLVSVYDNRGTPLIEDVMGDDAKISDTLIAVRSSLHFVRVFTIDGKLIFSSPYSFAVGVSKNGFAVRNLDNHNFDVYDTNGKIRWSDSFVRRAWVNDSMVVTESESGIIQMRAWDKSEPLMTETSVTEVAINDEVLALRHTDGWLSFFDRTGTQIFNVGQASQFQFIQGGFWVEVNGQTNVYDNQGNNLLYLSTEKVVASSNQFIATKNRNGLFTAYRRDGQGIKVFPQATAIALSNEGVALRFGSIQVIFYDASFTEAKYFDVLDLTNFGISNHLFWYSRQFEQTSEFSNLSASDSVTTVESRPWVSQDQISSTQVNQNWGSF